MDHCQHNCSSAGDEIDHYSIEIDPLDDDLFYVVVTAVVVDDDQVRYVPVDEALCQTLRKALDFIQEAFTKLPAQTCLKQAAEVSIV